MLTYDGAQHHQEKRRQVYRAEIHMTKTVRKAGNMYTVECSLAFATRIGEISDVSQKVHKALNPPSLHQIFKKTFIKLHMVQLPC